MPKHDFRHCPRCNADTIPAIAQNQQGSEFWLTCTNPDCNTYINTYIPQEHQVSVHLDAHTYVGNFGAYGTGKTLTSRQELYKHLFLTDNANILVGANVSAQYEQTIKRDIELDLPNTFIKKVSIQKSYVDFINGARLMYRSFDDPNKLRSLNLTFFVIIEASEVNGETFDQLKTRLRNMAATTEGGSDWRKGIVESNPDSGWVRTLVLHNSEVIQAYGNVSDMYNIPDSQKDPSISSHVASTDVNSYLPPTFIAELIKNKPNWWVERFVYGSFKYAEGLVYPSVPAAIIQPFPIPKNWKRIIASDYGLRDNFTYILGAIDIAKGVLYIYREEVTNDKNLEELAKLYFKATEDIPAGGLYGAPILDPMSGAKRDYNKKTLFDHFLDYGIAFKPGHVSVTARVYRLNTYLESQKIKIFSTCINLLEELADYKFPQRTLANYKMTSKALDKPIDKNNHCINPLEWITMDLPANPSDLLYGVYNMSGTDVTSLKPQDPIFPNALDDKEDNLWSGYL